MELKIDISEQPIIDAFNRLLQLGAHPSPALEAVGRSLTTNILFGFRNSISPYGSKWDAPKHRSGKPLVDRGHLRNSISYRVVGHAVEIGTNLPYAAIHQFGGVVQRKRKQELFFMLGDMKVPVKQAYIPPRVFLPTYGLPDSWRDDATGAVLEVIDRATLGK